MCFDLIYCIIIIINIIIIVAVLVVLVVSNIYRCLFVFIADIFTEENRASREKSMLSVAVERPLSKRETMHVDRYMLLIHFLFSNAT